jgi:hypothetical protein
MISATKLDDDVSTAKRVNWPLHSFLEWPPKGRIAAITAVDWFLRPDQPPESAWWHLGVCTDF